MNIRANHVAGDFYDYFLDGQGRLTLVIADVSGHGVPAAILMAVTRTLIRNIASSGLSPAQIVRRADAVLIQDSAADMFVTMILCQYDPGTGELTYANAGHPAPCLVRATGEIEPVGTSTAPLLGVGFYNEEDFTQATIHLAMGDTFVLYTGGVPEARSPEGSFFGMERFCDLLQGERDKPLKDACQAVIDAVDRYAQGRPADDVTVLMFRRV